LRLAALNEKFEEIDVGDEEKLAVQQESASNYAAEKYEEMLYGAEEILKLLHGKLKTAVDSLDSMP